MPTEIFHNIILRKRKRHFFLPAIQRKMPENAFKLFTTIPIMSFLTFAFTGQKHTPSVFQNGVKGIILLSQC